MHTSYTSKLRIYVTLDQILSWSLELRIWADVYSAPVLVNCKVDHPEGKGNDKKACDSIRLYERKEASVYRGAAVTVHVDVIRNTVLLLISNFDGIRISNVKIRLKSRYRPTSLIRNLRYSHLG